MDRAASPYLEALEPSDCARFTDLGAAPLHGLMISLEPLHRSHLTGLAEAGCVEALWEHQPFVLRHVGDMRWYVEHALSTQAEGLALPFVVLLNDSGQVLGMTRYMRGEAAVRDIEIGGTWITPRFQRSGAHVEAKLLLLKQAFEYWGAESVSLNVPRDNRQAWLALRNLGAVEVDRAVTSTASHSFGSSWEQCRFEFRRADWPSVRLTMESRFGRAIHRHFMNQRSS